MFENSLFINFSATEKFAECDYDMKHAVRRAILATLEYEGFLYDARVSVTFCDNEYIRKLNKEYRNKDSATDVLSFPLYDFNDDEPTCDPDGSMPLGDIVISLERAAEQAQEIGNTLLEEVIFLAVHSTLHLLGYDHELSKDDEEAQCLAQKDIISIINED